MDNKMEDVFVQLWRNSRLFEATLNPISPSGTPISGLATSHKYGLYLALAPENRIFSAVNTALVNNLNKANANLRLIDYPDAECEIIHLEVSHDGEILAVAVNRSSGAFVELFDVQCFDPKATKQIFPLAVVRLSKNDFAKIVSFAWNPCQNVFAASTIDNTLCTVQYELKNGSSFTLLGLQSLNAAVKCISWSPKGKQLTVGDATGKMHQLTPELATVRSIDAPQQIALVGGSGFRCVDLCWLSTTEWLVVYGAAQPPASNESLAVSLLTVKKQQPPSWSFIDNALDRSANPDRPTTLRLYPLLEWQLVFICSSSSAVCAVIGVSGGQWRRFNVPILLAKEDANNYIYPTGCAFDLSNNLPVIIAGQQLPPQPVFNIFTTTGWIISYNVVSLIERPLILKIPAIANGEQAKFGNPPANYVPRRATSQNV